MEFMNRGAGQAAAPARVTTNGGGASGGGRRNSHWKDSPMWLKVVWLVLLFSATVLLVSMVALLYFGNPKESKYIDETKQQAVFLTNGQVYFGKVKTVNSEFMDLQNIYYLNVNQQVQPNQENNQQNAQNNITLVKLGCELHGPIDRMIINREQVTFWENLKDDGQVAKAIDQWVKQNPNGQKCQTATNTNSNTNTSTEP